MTLDHVISLDSEGRGQALRVYMNECGGRGSSEYKLLFQKD